LGASGIKRSSVGKREPLLRTTKGQWEIV